MLRGKLDPASIDGGEAVLADKSVIPGDSLIREALLTRLQGQYRGEVNTVFVHELGLLKGQVRVDLAVVNGVLHGYEIKSDRDTLRRLSAQVARYGQVLDRATLVVGTRHVEQALALVPPWWEVLVAKVVRGKIRLVRQRRGLRNRTRDPRALVELLWLDHALALVEARGGARGYRSKSRSVVWDRVCELYNVDEIASAVRGHLKARPISPSRRLSA
jgi:hypothetical protein